jgi:hypothetical protein
MPDDLAHVQSEQDAPSPIVLVEQARDYVETV